MKEEVQYCLKGSAN